MKIKPNNSSNHSTESIKKTLLVQKHFQIDIRLSVILLVRSTNVTNNEQSKLIHFFWIHLLGSALSASVWIPYNVIIT